ncbi:hypothetical protein, unknown function [Leishmania mexicana MHOM/GT/2001/U1103]|uniref:Uncharacterized protein n=1 Tax=Leishmania mexicana (strain MHOM/GT/2001/U1103) TaxID=929439 RepID=E9AV84_LEIMU|nr:hypothetical protein, unknown function [Leishmania mexicana MHOM/GT/2001/U1103]CBZ26866.1 hypothetical protein, unknown function [Leishmania mexicana MHOM/GT/2001/U1103]
MSEHTSTHADLPPMSRADLAPGWVLAAAPRTTPTTELAASVPSSASADAAPFARHLVSTKRASSRDVEPYQACRAQVDQLLELQSEQVGLAQSLRAALRVAPMRASTAKRVMDNVENIAPDCHGCSGSSSSSSSRQQKPPSAGTEADSQPSPTPSSLPSLVSSVTSLVHRLHVLQRESAEFAATRCLPALAELFATFEAYWVWKRSSMCDGGVQEEEEASATLAAASSASTHRAMDGATTPSQAAQKRPSQQQRPPTLRQRYDQALRVRDELLSFLQLHAEAVRALDVQLEQWRQCRGSEPAAKSARGWLTVSPTGTSGVPVAVPHDANAQTRTQRCEFEAYVCQLVEVSQATHHIAQLLQAALRALCRPSPRTSRPSLKLSADAVVEDESLSSSSKAPRQAEANAAPSPGTDERRFVRLQARSSVNTGGLANSRTDAKRVSAYPSTEGSGRPSSSPAPNTSGTVGRPECVLRSLSTPKARTLRGCAKPTPCGDARSVSGTAGDAQCSWIDALSPLTPPPTAATASASPSASPSLRIEHSEPHQQLRRQRHGRGRLSPSPSPPGAAAQAEGSASPEAASHSSSLYAAQSTAGDVSLSPLTVQRGTAAVVPAHSREESADRERHCPVPMPSFSSWLGGPGDAEEDSDVQAAVTPVITMRLAATGSATRNLGDDVASRLSANAEHPPRSGRHIVSQDGARSLLRELASASADAAAGADEPLPTCPQPLVSRRRDVPDVPAFADSTRESSAEVTANAPGVTAVYVPPPSEQPASCHDDASVTALTPVIVDVAKSGEGHAASQPFPPPPPPLQRASAMHTAAAAAATRASVSRNTSMSLHLLSPRSLSIDGSASRRTTCNECGGAGQEGLSSAVRAASISTSLWPRLHHRAVSLSSSSAASVLPSADVAGGAQVARNTTALVYTPSHALTNEPEGGGGAASTYSTSRTVDPNFYTARASGAGVSPPPALAATFHGSASSAGREPSPTPLEPTQYPEQQQQGRQARHAQEWVRTFSPTPLPLDSLERELDEVQQRLQVPAPPPHSSPALSASSAASDNHTAPWPQRRSLEDRAMLTMREELKALRAEQRYSLHKMRKYVKHTLEEVAEAVSALSSHNHSSRGSSCASSRSQRSGTAHEGNDNDADASAAGARVTVAAEKQRHASHASEQARADAFAKSNEAASASAAIKLSGNSATPPSRLSTTQQQQTAPAVPASPPSKAAELQRSLAVAEAKSARLEQLTVQLKKRLWMAELSRLSPTSATPGAGELTATAKRHLSLRDAFVYGLSSDASDPEDYDGSRPKTGQASGGVGYSDEDGSAADGVAAEERAMLYLVDRELGYRTALDARAHSQRRPSALRQTTSEAYSSSRLVPYDGRRSSSTEHERSPNMRCFEDDTATYHGLAVTSTGSAGIAGGYSGRRLCSSSAAPIGAISGTTATRSLGILQQRASIFQVLRQNQAAWDAQSSASTGPQQQQQSERSQLCPPPPLQHCSANTVAEVSGELTASVPSRAHSSPPSATPQPRPHPYNADPASSRHGREANGGAAVGFPRQRVFPHYYTAISGGSDTGFVSGAELQASTSASALRAEQVLQNAKRLLQRRSASLAAGHHNISDNSHTSASLSGALQSSLTVASSPQMRANAGDHRSEMPYHHGEGATGGVSAALVGRFSRPGQWGDCVEQLDGATPPPRAFAAPALHSGMTDAATALQRVSGSLDRGADSISAADSGHGPRSHPSSPESAYHGYDTSPCSAVAYSTSKIPRPSSPSAAKAAPKWTQQWCTPTSTAAGPPLLADVSRATTSVGPPRHAQHRVDSATSPISRDGAEVRTTAGRGERDAYIHSDGGLHHRELSARTVTTSIEGDYSPPSDRTTDTRSTCGFRSSSSPLDAAVEQHVHDSRQEVPVALTSRVGQSTSRRTSCSTSSTLSCGSAQQELLDTLENQESTLAAALNHLQEQQRQVREKHQQVSLLAKQAALVAPARAPLRTPRDDYQRAAGSAAAAAATTRKQLTRTFSRDRRGNASAAGTSYASSDLRHLLERFAAAEMSLAERERRVRKALRVVQRQRSALSRDDLL